MIDRERFETIVSELLDELPEAFFLELSGGVLVSDEAPQPAYAKSDDIYVFGEYRVSKLGRQVVVYKGSYDRLYPNADEGFLRRDLRRVIRHEFRHHMEFLSGIHGSKSLEAEDERAKRDYLRRHERLKGDN